MGQEGPHRRTDAGSSQRLEQGCGQVMRVAVDDHRPSSGVRVRQVASAGGGNATHSELNAGPWSMSGEGWSGRAEQKGTARKDGARPILPGRASRRATAVGYSVVR